MKFYEMLLKHCLGNFTVLNYYIGNQENSKIYEVTFYLEREQKNSKFKKNQSRRKDIKEITEINHTIENRKIWKKARLL